MKRKKREKRKNPLLTFAFIILISILFSIPKTIANDQIITSFYPINQPPSQPINPNPPNGATDIDTTVTLSVIVYDETSNTVDVYFYDASDDSLIGIDYNVTSDWSNASVTWSGLEGNTIYQWYAIANDSQYENRSNTWTFTTRYTSGGGSGEIIPPILNQPPYANITGPLFGYVNQTLIFSANYSFDPDGTITHYRWDFENDGLFDIDWIQDVIVTHTYSKPGNYTVKLQVRDQHGAISTDTNVIIIKQLEPHLQLPVARANGPYTSFTNVNITFNSTGSYDPDGIIVNYTWHFGDKNISYLKNPIHSYTKPGNYIVYLTVVDNDNLSNSAVLSIYIRETETKKEKEYQLPIPWIIILAIIATILDFIIIFKRRRKNKNNKETNTINKNKDYLENIHEIERQVDEIEFLTDNNSYYP